MFGLFTFLPVSSSVRCWEFPIYYEHHYSGREKTLPFSKDLTRGNIFEIILVQTPNNAAFLFPKLTPKDISNDKTNQQG